MRDYAAALQPAGDVMMPSWLYRIMRWLVPMVRDQEERLERTDREVRQARLVRHQSVRLRRLVHSYTRANRRLSDMRR